MFIFSVINICICFVPFFKTFPSNAREKKALNVISMCSLIKYFVSQILQLQIGLLYLC